MFTFLLVLQAIVAAVMIGVILMQKSEGGGLGIGGGGSPAGLLSARGASNFLTRATTVLATLFVVLSIALGALASVRSGGGSIDTSLSKAAQPATTSGAAPADGGGALGNLTAPTGGDAKGAAAPAAGEAKGAPAPADKAAPAPAGVPIEQ